MSRAPAPRPPFPHLPMTAQNNFEHHGTFAANPFAELLVEILQAKFSGSLRLTFEDQKAIIYFREGAVIYAVSNSKLLRIFNLLLRKSKVDTKIISRHPNFANDLEFSASLIAGGILSKEEMNAAFTEQIESIIVDVLTWPGGEWVFNPLVRARGDLAYPIEVYKILIDYARCSCSEHVSQRFKSVQESFAVIEQTGAHVQLQSHESYVLSQFNGLPLKIDELRDMSAMPKAGLLQALYVLWLGGLLARSSWNAAFSAAKIGDIRTARLAKVTNAADINESVSDESKPRQAGEIQAEPVAEPAKLPMIAISLDEYLERVEKAETHYDTLGIDAKADASAIKTAYFSMAKLFHPDRYHRESSAVLRRIQTAFTLLAQAHETLKTTDSREAYDAKMYKEIEAREKRRAAGQSAAEGPVDRKTEHGLESFEEGLNLLNDEEYEAAAAYLARAVHYSPQNALYHAYYGKALSADDKQRHKAESELQTAARLDPKNAKIRLMLVEFLIGLNMLKRADGELKRFLELVPNNKEAMAMLAKIQT
jgi:Flp pilus assembly protein TadD